MVALDQVAAERAQALEHSPTDAHALAEWTPRRPRHQGVAGSDELRYEIGDLAKPVRDLQAFGFIDGGLVDDLRIDNEDDELASAGGGLRARLLRRLHADIEAAFPLSGARLDSGNKNPRVAFELRALF